jgi:excinuclease ABC subunit C
MYHHNGNTLGNPGGELGGFLSNAVTVIRKAAENAGAVPGIYKMLDSDGNVIYIGKARNLRNRLRSYTILSNLSNRTKMMVSNIRDVDVVVVNSEMEALLLESNLIKKLKPFYNVLLKDDKTFPYIVIDSSSEFPRIFKYRTLKPKGNDFYGPYPLVCALDDTIKLIQKMFLIRGCSDTYFMRRDRPCLQYYIKKCSAPCMRKITKDEYAEGVTMARALLRGEDEPVRNELVRQMRIAAESKDFEHAAFLRDRIKSLSNVQSKQYIQIDDLRSIDFIALSTNSGSTVTAGVTFFRAGRNVGFESFTLEHTHGDSDQDVLASFIQQFYRTVSIPSCIVTDHDVSEHQLVIEFFTMVGTVPKLRLAQRGVYKHIMESCKHNVCLRQKKNEHNQFSKALPELCMIMGRDTINRIEVYDNSHIQGTNACGAMIVFEDNAIQRGKFRKFNIPDDVASGGDDIAMMRFVFCKRFKSARISEVPDLIMVDGGEIQLAVANEIIREFDLSDRITVIGIAKQNDRRVGDEKIVPRDMGEKISGGDGALLLFLIMLRNEAHRAAVGAHRKKRREALSRSVVDLIPSVGKFRKKVLLEHFGSIDDMMKASLEDLKAVRGISSKIAELIFHFFRGNVSRGGGDE